MFGVREMRKVILSAVVLVLGFAGVAPAQTQQQAYDKGMEAQIALDEADYDRVTASNKWTNAWNLYTDLNSRRNFVTMSPVHSVEFETYHDNGHGLLQDSSAFKTEGDEAYFAGLTYFSDGGDLIFSNQWINAYYAYAAALTQFTNAIGNYEQAADKADDAMLELIAAETILIIYE